MVIIKTEHPKTKTTTIDKAQVLQKFKVMKGKCLKVVTRRPLGGAEKDADIFFIVKVPN